MKVLIPRADGRLIDCPQCHRAAGRVTPAQTRAGSQQIISAHGWWRVDCPLCGPKLYPSHEVVELTEVSHV